MAIKVVLSAKTSIRKYIEDVNKSYGIARDFQLMEEEAVQDYVKTKLLSGHECAIFSLEQFAYNELVPTFTKL